MSLQVERFDTQARLLSTVRRDGHRAAALDTGNAYSYIQGVGWTQLVPVTDPVTGQATVAGQPLVAQGTGAVAYDSPGKLLPDPGTVGQVLSVVADDAIGYVTRETSGTITAPIDFTDGASHAVLSVTIPGGGLGAHGFARVTILAQVVTNASRTATFHTSTTLDPDMVTGVNMGTGFQWGLEYELLYINRSATAQSVKQKLITTRWSLGGTESTLEDISQIQSAAVQDTTVDWTIDVSVQASAAITGTAEVESPLVEYGYIT